ncbi:MAG: hypothetical protein ACYSWZ_15440 [Planctomycetota bacterium]
MRRPIRWQRARTKTALKAVSNRKLREYPGLIARADSEPAIEGPKKHRRMRAAIIWPDNSQKE